MLALTDTAPLPPMWVPGGLGLQASDVEPFTAISSTNSLLQSECQTFATTAPIHPQLLPAPIPNGRGWGPSGPPFPLEFLLPPNPSASPPIPCPYPLLGLCLLERAMVHASLGNPGAAA